MLMRICIISTGLLPSPPNGYGGIEKITWDLARLASFSGHEVFLLTTDDSKMIGSHTAMKEDKETGGVLHVIGCGESSWNWDSEQKMYNGYRLWLEKEFGEGQGVV